MQSSILLIESDPHLKDLYRIKLSQQFNVIAASGAQDAMDALDDPDRMIELIVMSVQLDRNNGIELLHEIRSYDDWLDIPIVLLRTGQKAELSTRQMKRYGVHQILYKPDATPAKLLEVARSVHMQAGQ